ncbi:MAG: response regulator [Desulfobacterales bacterium]
MSEKKSYFEGKKILAVDDEKDILEMIEEELEMADVDTALDYQTASEKIRQNQYDLAILDIMGVDGLTLLEKAVEKKIPAIMLTAHAMNYETLMHSIRKGSICFLPKEKLGELVRLLDILLSAYDSGKSTWAILFDELGDYFDKKFGAPMGTVEWICRRIDQQK